MWLSCARPSSIRSIGHACHHHLFWHFACSPGLAQRDLPTFDFLLDPHRKIYQAYGLERSILRSWNLRTIWTYVKLLSRGRKWRDIQGDSTQLGGDFLIDRDGIIRLAFCSHDPTDRPYADDLLALIRCDLHLKN